MTFSDPAASLKDRYLSADRGDQVLAIHLFGIEFAESLDGHSFQEIAEAATGHRSYGTEIRKGFKIAPHVDLKRAD